MIISGLIGGISGALTKSGVSRVMDALAVPELQVGPTVSLSSPPLRPEPTVLPSPPEAKGTPPPPPPPPLPLLPDPPSSPDFEAKRIEIDDGWGNTATIDVLVLSREFSWSFARVDEVVGPSRKPRDMIRFLKSPGLQSYLASSRDLIAIGTASCEGERIEEGERARRRAESLAHWIQQAVPKGRSGRPPGPLKLNLGQYARPCADVDHDLTLNQRRVVLLSVVDKDPDDLKMTDMEEALREAFVGEESLAFLRPGEYFLFELDQ
jgi:hypothetical protein